MISIIDYGLGNIRAFENIFRSLGIPSERVTNADQLQNSNKLLLPGVGAFDTAIDQLGKSGMLDLLEFKVCKQNIPILGVCVGMQMMCQNSDEGKFSGLNWLKAEVKKFDNGEKMRSLPLPHMGWNVVNIIRDNPLFDGLDKMDCYFLHSYYVECQLEEDVIAGVNYHQDFCCGIAHENIYGVQFHPEKSHDSGIRLLKNFAEHC